MVLARHLPRTARAIGLAVADIIRGRTQATAVEPELKVQELAGENCRLLYVSATDRTVSEPTAEDFKYGIQGVAVIGAVMATFTVLTNLEDGPERTAALEILRSARHDPPAE